jgi:hypothetical protein
MSKRRTKEKKSSKKRSINYTEISKHKFDGKNLVPPFVQLPNLNLTSWMNDRMPDYLWVALLLTKLGRVKGLNILRQVIQYFISINEGRQIKIFPDVSHTGLKTMDIEHRDKLFNIITQTEECKNALTPLLMYDQLPLKEIWRKFIKYEFTLDKSEFLYSSVANVLDHQSQLSTDCRWLRVILQYVGGYLHLPTEEMARQLFDYPNYGEQKSVRPLIRSMEVALDGFDKGKKDSEWINNFWKENLDKTPCLAFLPKYKNTTISVNSASLDLLYEELVNHYFKSLTSTGIDIKHDAIFGVAFFSISILKEILNSSLNIGARNTLRTLLESYITLAYLIKKDEENLWKSHRVFGAGQAKLTFLKLDSIENMPKYVNIETLRELANEDLWQEFLSINTGHWENTNLRKISIDADLKDVYDRYYSWTSAFTHANWGALRSSIYTFCGNPLHRLHRVPRKVDVELPSVIEDSIYFINEIIKLVSQVYPGINLQRLSELTDQSPNKN